MMALTANGWTLMYLIGDAVCGPVSVGDVVEDSRGTALTVVAGIPPHKVNSTGVVHVMERGPGPDSINPRVIGARWVHEGGGHAAS